MRNVSWVFVPSLLEQWMPVYDVAPRYQTLVKASRARVWQAILEMRPADLWIVQWLFALRRLSFRRVEALPLLEAFTRARFLLLDCRKDEELVLGVAGRFWTFSGGVACLPSAAAWRDFREEGAARSAMNFRLEEWEPGRTRVITETRVETFGPRARRRFRLYWSVVGPCSGLIRRAMLAEARSRAEMAAP